MVADTNFAYCLVAASLFFFAAGCIAAFWNAYCAKCIAASRVDGNLSPRKCLNLLVVISFVCIAIKVGATKTNSVNNLPLRQQTVIPAVQKGECVFQAGLTGLDSGGPGLSQLENPVNVVNPVLTTLSGSLTVSQEDITRGHRLSCSTNDLAYDYAMPTSGVIVGNWHKRGTYGEWMRLELGDFAFPLGTNDERLTSFSVFNDGKIRLKPRDRAREICAVGVPMLCMQGASCFWVADASPAEKWLTWSNFFLNADTNTPVNAQIRLFANGDFETRSNDWVRVYKRINPHDWDDDGLVNEIDLSPTASDGNCFGTGVEWLKANCGNVLAASLATNGEIEVSWIGGANPNAYYWLTFTSLADNNHIAIVCDDDSNLGDLHIIANSNQVCRVPLLVGADYNVSSDGDIEGFLASDSRVEIREHSDGGCSVVFPLYASIMPKAENLSRYDVTIGPVDVGARCISVTGGCCTNHFDETLMIWTCADDCTCNGGNGHDIAIVATWEGYQKVFWAWSLCPCRPAEVEEDCTNIVSGVTLAMPDTIFENQDNDVSDDPFYPDYVEGRIDDDDVARCKVSSGGASGTLTFNGFSGFRGEAMVQNEIFNPRATEVANGHQVEMGGWNSSVFPFFIHACNYSRSYRRARIGFTWSSASGESEVFHKRFTVARPIVEPICSETTNVVENGVEHNYVVNPCGVGVDKKAYFRIRVLPDDYPDEKIVWSNETAGAVEFVGGNTGRAVTMRGVSPGLTHLTIHIGDSPSDPPHFPLRVVTNRVFHIKPWVVRRADGSVTRSDSELETMIAEVNDIYAQIGVSYILEPTGVVNNSDAANVYYYATNAVSATDWSRERLFEFGLPNSINCYFINEFIEMSKEDILGVWCANGIVMVGLANARVWGHELGHQLGAEDIYDSSGLHPSVIGIPFRYDYGSMDWSNGCRNINPGYYDMEMTCDRIISRLLMNGEVNADNTTAIDITSGRIHGVVNAGDGGKVIGDADIGLLNR